MAAETGGRVWVEFVPGGSPTHVGIYGCDDLLIAAIVASLATMVPGYDPKRPLALYRVARKAASMP